MPDIQIRSTSNAVLPEDYIVPGTVTLTPKQIHVDYVDNSASGDWLPCITFISDAGVVLGRAVDQAVIVTAGDDASVTWFPGIKNASGAATLPQLNQSYLAESITVAHTIHDSAVTTLPFVGFTSAPGYGDAWGALATATNPLTYVKFASVVATLVVNWPAANYDRYIELVTANSFETTTIYDPRVRNSVSPDGDRQTLTAVFQGGPGAPPTTVTAQVFQASGVDRSVTASWELHTIPYGVAPYVLP